MHRVQVELGGLLESCDSRTNVLVSFRGRSYTPVTYCRVEALVICGEVAVL